MNSSETGTNGKLNLNLDESKILDIYEEIENLRVQLIRRNKKYTNSSSSQWQIANKLRTDPEQLQAFSTQLRQEYQRMFSLTCEANIISTEMQRHVIYNVTLQTPVSYLKPNERTVNCICAPAVQVNRPGLTPQIWNTEKFEYKLSEMRKTYQRWKISENKNELLKDHNSFYDDEAETLIGVANIYLKALFYSSKLDYIVPIINDKGEISGSLYVTLDQTGSPMLKERSDLQINSATRSSINEWISIDGEEQSLSTNHSASQQSFEDEGIEESFGLFDGKNDKTTIKFAIKEARNLPEINCESIVCRYVFINPKLDKTAVATKPADNERHFSFDHKEEFTFRLTDTFRTTCLENSIPVEIWSQSSTKTVPKDIPDTEEDNEHLTKVREISKCWKDVKRHIQLSVEIQELNEAGEWKPVPVDVDDRVPSGGIYQLKQGKSKRVVVQVRVLPRSDALPLHIDTIRSIDMGLAGTRKLDAPVQLDSYQDHDLQLLKEQWLNLIEKRKSSVETELRSLHCQTNKSEHEIQKENFLLEELRQLAQEQDIAVLPPPATGIPGSPADWDPPITIEHHRPLIFLDLDPFRIKPAKDRAGTETLLSEEDPSNMIQLSLIQNVPNEIPAIALWNPARHRSQSINQVTANGTLIYLIVKVIVVISEPVHMEIVLRKRIAVTINTNDGWRPKKLVKSFLGYETYSRTSVVYEIVSNIPKRLYAVEDQTQAGFDCISEENISKHIHNAFAIDSFLLLDKLRQEVLLAEKSLKQQIIAKSTSAPNITIYNQQPVRIHDPSSYISLLSIKQDVSKPSVAPNEEDKPSDPIPDKISVPEEQVPSLQIPSVVIECVCEPVKVEADVEGQGIPTEIRDSKLKQPDSISSSLSADSFPTSNYDDTPGCFSVGDQVIVNTGHSIVSKKGTIRFIGEIDGKKGIWFGIELREPVGKHNGTVNQRAYFTCAPAHGVFVRKDKLKVVT
ncbi:unnamed protein product [Adineta ricciae]|uniref:CAP-Gly domain-containing protein n=1 Tax=Adineta ricciae TaxID=249248 RepID=A0A814UTT6_ADIRI|nr:unnamed protein product [Adineta ricciae]CAF1197005.1 unnamed protein product [Adineta ricciae]